MPSQRTLPALDAIPSIAQLKEYYAAFHAARAATQPTKVSSHRYRTHDMPVDIFASAPTPATLPESPQQRIKRQRREKQKRARQECVEREKRVKEEKAEKDRAAPVMRKDRWGKKSQEEMVMKMEIREMQQKLREREARRQERRERSGSSEQSQ